MILVVSIKMTLYRLAVRSQVVDALVEAAENGKEVGTCRTSGKI